jgi:hypothetical protein
MVYADGKGVGASACEKAILLEGKYRSHRSPPAWEVALVKHKPWEKKKQLLCRKERKKHAEEALNHRARQPKFGVFWLGELESMCSFSKNALSNGVSV